MRQFAEIFMSNASFKPEDYPFLLRPVRRTSLLPLRYILAGYFSGKTDLFSEVDRLSVLLDLESLEKAREENAGRQDRLPHCGMKMKKWRTPDCPPDS